MSRNLGYTKKFIILKNDFSNMVGFGQKGHVKLEIKGLKSNLSVSLENAEPNQTYNVLLISYDKSYDVGKVYTENNGKGREELVINTTDLGSNGIPLDKINGILILRDENVLLGGYMNREDGTIEKFVNRIDLNKKAISVNEPKLKEQIEQAITEESISQETLPEKVTPEEVTPEEVIPQELDIEDTIEQVELDDECIWEEITQEIAQEITKEIVEEIVQEITPEQLLGGNFISKAPEYTPYDDVCEMDTAEEIPLVETKIEQVLEVAAGEDFEPVFDPIVEINQESEPTAQEEEWTPIETSNEEILKVKMVDYEQNRRIIQRDQTTNYILNILRYFPYIEPFDKSLGGYNWWKIDFQDEAKGFLPYYSYLVGGNQKNRRLEDSVTAKELMMMHNHYLFGLYNIHDEVKFYIYGVPGGFTKDEHPHSGVTGFNTWFSGNDVDGYWLLYVDPLTGKIIYPINPMIPTV